jgi:hypothetical protein
MRYFVNKIVSSIIFFCTLHQGLFAQCPTVEAVMVDACGTEELNEFVIINTGGGFNTNLLQFSFPTQSNTSNFTNNDINIDIDNLPGPPCGLQAGNASLIGGCSNVISVGPGFNLPPNAYLVLQTSAGANNVYNFSGICGNGGCIYVIQSSCFRSFGGFTNMNTGSPGPRTFVLALSSGMGCFFSYTYNTTLLPGNQGDYFIPPGTFGNNGCSAPPVGTAPAEITPTFEPIPVLCQNQTPPFLQGISNNGIFGTWNPGLISTSTTGTTTYTFTPSPGQCASTAILSVTVNPTVMPVFSISDAYCQGDPPTALPGTSNNAITGTWNPATISTSNTGPTIYTFTPSPGQCATTQTLSVTVNPSITPTFSNFGPFCIGESAPALPGVSLNGISGSWSPPNINTAAAGTTNYIFTPNPGQCGIQHSIMITVNAEVTPAFSPVNPLCQGVTPPTLPGTSLDGINGSWSPATINTSTPGTASYTFTPSPGQCAGSASLNVTVNAISDPVFNSFGPYCQGETPASLPVSSINGISGSWSPPAINTSSSGSAMYIFTPDPGQCANSYSTSIQVNPQTIPTFDPVPLLCQFSVPPALPTLSNNGITGQWAPASIFTGLPGTQTYIFTPSSGQCAEVITINITVIQEVTPLFDIDQNLCQFETPPLLPGTSLNGITGSWNPAVIATGSTGAFNYTFTPGAGSCVTALPIQINVAPNITPALPSMGPFCTSDPPVFLPNIVDGISGIWYGSGVTSNQFSPVSAGGGTHVITFEPIPDQCAFINTTTVQVTANPTGNLSGNPQLCKGECGTVNFNFNGGSGTFNINMNINVAGFFNFNFPMVGVTNNTTLNVCYQDNIPPFNPLTNTIYIPLNTPPGNASLTLLNFNSTPPGFCGNGVVGSPGTISITLLPEPTASSASISVCDDDNDGIGIFNLTSVNNTVKNNVAANNVNWFSDAAANFPISNPLSYSSGSTTVYAQVVNPQGCTNTVPVNLILQSPVVPAATPFTTCVDGTVISLPLSLNNIVGSWSDVNGHVAANQFNPAGVPSGDYTISFTPAPNQCAIPVSTTVNVVSAGPTPLPPVIASGCIGSSVIFIDAAPGGISGMWSGSPFLAGIQFNTAASGTGTFTLTFTPDASAGCLQPNTTTVEVLPNTSLPQQVLSSICQNDAPYPLPSNLQGYTGNWINDINVFNNIFSPDQIPGENQTYNLIFTPDDFCINNINAVIQVNAPTVLTPVNFSGLCLTSSPFTLPSSVDGIAGSWSYSGTTLFQFDPVDFGEGIFILSFNPASGTCALSTTGQISVNAFTAGDDNYLQYCNDGEDIVNLNNFLTPSATTGGTWAFQSNPVNDPLSFDLSLLEPGLNTLSYSLNDPVCGSDEALININVSIPAFAGNDNNITVCQNDLTAVDFLSTLGTPDTGGTWVVPPGLNVNFNDLSAVNLTELSSGTFSFSYIIPGGVCPGASSTTTVNISVFNSAGPDINIAVCEGSTLNLNDYISPTFSGGNFESQMPLSGFSGTTWNTTGIPAGIYPFVYYFDNASPCPSDTASFNITLAATLSAGINVNSDFCESSILNLNNFLDPSASQGGQFYYEGVLVPGGLFTVGSLSTYLFEYRIGDGVTCPVSTSGLTLTKISKPDFSAALQFSDLCPEQSTMLIRNFNPNVTNAELHFTMTSASGIIYRLQSVYSNSDIINIRASGNGPYSFNNIPVGQTFTIRLDSFRIIENGCVFPGPVQSLTLTTRANPVRNITRQLCTGESITVGSTLFNESNPVGSVSIPAGPGEICDSIINVNLSFAAPSPVTEIRQTTCDENFSITVGGNVVFNRNNPSGTVMLTNVFGCDSLVSVEITFSTFSAGSFTATTCNPDELFIIGPRTFSLSDPSGTVPLTGASVSGCDSIVSVNIIYLQPTAGNYSVTTCDEAFSVNIGSETFNRQNPSGAVNLAGAALNGCDSLVTVNITYLGSSENNIEVITCNYNYTLNIQGNIFSKTNPSGTVELSNAAINGCDSIINVNIVFEAFDFQLDAQTICGTETGNISILSASDAGPWTVEYNSGTNVSVSALPYTITVPAGDNVIKLTNPEGCTTEKMVDIISGTTPELMILQTVLPNGNIQLNIQPENNVLSNFMWNTSSPLSCSDCAAPVVFNPVDGQLVSVSYNYLVDCTDELQTILAVETPGNIILPNIFRPLSDGGNSSFFVKLPENMNATVRLMKIFDRWGNLVAEKTNIPANTPSDGWDGRYKSEAVVPGVYIYYILLAVDGEEKERILYGDVTIMR